GTRMDLLAAIYAARVRSLVGQCSWRYRVPLPGDGPATSPTLHPFSWRHRHSVTESTSARKSRDVVERRASDATRLLHTPTSRWLRGVCSNCRVGLASRPAVRKVGRSGGAAMIPSARATEADAQASGAAPASARHHPAHWPPQVRRGG